MRCDLIIVTYNQLEYTKGCIASIEKNTPYPHRIIVVDNASGEDTLAYLRALEKEQRIVLIANTVNEGWVKAVNRGIASSDAEYVCVMNNDLICYPGWLDEMVRVAKMDPKIGLVNPEWELPKRYPFGREIYIRTVIRAGAGKYIETDWARGFCFLITRALLRRIGGFDLEFSPGYYDDWDYSVRAIKSGFIVARAHGAFVWHFKNITYLSVGNKHELSTILGQKGALFHDRWGYPLRVFFAGWRPWDRAVLTNVIRELLRDQHRVTVLGFRTGLRHSNLREFRFFPGVRLFLSAFFALDNARFNRRKRYDLIVCSAGVRKFLQLFPPLKEYNFFVPTAPDNSLALLKRARNLKYAKKME